MSSTRLTTIPPAAIAEAQIPLIYGIIAGLACKCSSRHNVDFLIKKDRIICASCGRNVELTPPLLGIYEGACACCISMDVKTTFVVDSNGNYICTWCGCIR